ncbi:transcriptional regulator [Mesorhizobium sp. CA13]|uniref:transcriptional regulator n=1 Tax=Mesorhizobium sp. CA13 TaxID=2876643 RepID=UPI001CCB3A08|nr:transcriptional regulator [Mesorhizobium sp. CA13]MBZ9856726.1 transcriptional regulator [Mesorhizobium sp. CA13]
MSANLAAASGGPSVARRLNACQECGTAAPANARFCSAAHRQAWNNRRLQRGAELYDLFMAHRFDRRKAQELRVLQAMNRMASIWNEDDKAAGRRSWRPTVEVLEERPYLRGVRGQA